MLFYVTADRRGRNIIRESMYVYLLNVCIMYSSFPRYLTGPLPMNYYSLTVIINKELNLLITIDIKFVTFVMNEIPMNVFICFEEVIVRIKGGSWVLD